MTVHRILSRINQRKYFSINRQYEDIRNRFRVDEEISGIVQKGSTFSGMKHYSIGFQLDILAREMDFIYFILLSNSLSLFLLSLEAIKTILRSRNKFVSGKFSSAIGNRSGERA